MWRAAPPSLPRASLPLSPGVGALPWCSSEDQGGGGGLLPSQPSRILLKPYSGVSTVSQAQHFIVVSTTVALLLGQAESCLCLLPIFLLSFLFFSNSYKLFA